MCDPHAMDRYLSTEENQVKRAKMLGRVYEVVRPKGTYGMLTAESLGMISPFSSPRLAIKNWIR